MCTRKAKANMQRFVDHMRTNTLSLIRLDAQDQPIRAASGFLIDVDGKYRVISAGHSIGRDSRWIIETAETTDRETLRFWIEDINIVDKLVYTFGADEYEVDLAWGEIDPVKLSDLLRQESKIQGEVTLPIYNGPMDVIPDADEVYGFSAWTAEDFSPSTGVLKKRAVFEVCMTTAGTSQDDGTIEFKLARPHLGDDYYYGTSGAPIADPTGRFVSMVIRGNKKRNCIIGVALHRFGSILRNLHT